MCLYRYSDTYRKYRDPAAVDGGNSAKFHDENNEIAVY
jgi:hypothetical protein